MTTKYDSTIEYPWSEIAIAYSQVLLHAKDSNWLEAYKEQSAVFQ